MHTLQNPRHETFALSIAQGATPEAAYRAAGFSDNNRKARSHELSLDPDIAARVAHLRSCLPHIEGLRDRFAPSILLMPETKEQMTAWLWQVMSGTRKVLPLQLRAATLFCRLNGWHLLRSTSQSVAPVSQTQDSSDQSAPSDPPPLIAIAAPTRPLADVERHLLAILAHSTVSHDTALCPVYPHETRSFYSTMADLALIEQCTPAASRPAPNPVSQSSSDPTSADNGPLPVAAQPRPVAANNSQPPLTSPPAPHLSPSQFADNQQVTATQSPNGELLTTSPIASIRRSDRMAPATIPESTSPPQTRAA